MRFDGSLRGGGKVRYSEFGLHPLTTPCTILPVVQLQVVAHLEGWPGALDSAAEATFGLQRDTQISLQRCQIAECHFIGERGVCRGCCGWRYRPTRHQDTRGATYLHLLEPHCVPGQAPLHPRRKTRGERQTARLQTQFRLSAPL